jgi:hypothetical protein
MANAAYRSSAFVFGLLAVGFVLWLPREHQLSFPCVALSIPLDTTTDSPGTNLETRIVTLRAKIDGTPPISLQWWVNKGSGFVPVSTTATNSVLVISNSRVTDSGSYKLFATNCAGFTNTTPVQVIVVEGVD